MSRVSSLRGDALEESVDSEGGRTVSSDERLIERQIYPAKYSPPPLQEFESLSPKAAAGITNSDEHRKEGAVARRQTAAETCPVGPGTHERRESGRSSLSFTLEVPVGGSLSPRQYAATLGEGGESKRVSGASLASASGPLAVRAGVTIYVYMHI